MELLAILAIPGGTLALIVAAAVVMIAAVVVVVRIFTEKGRNGT